MPEYTISVIPGEAIETRSVIMIDPANGTEKQFLDIELVVACRYRILGGARNFITARKYTFHIWSSEERPCNTKMKIDPRGETISIGHLGLGRLGINDAYAD